MQQERITSLDGFRGMACLAVLTTHSLILRRDGWEGLVSDVLHYGWTGIEAFFVLSGFLITGILIRSRDGRGYYRSFYLRRALRVFPVYYAVLLLVFVVLPDLLPQERSLHQYRGSPWWYALYGNNLAEMLPKFRQHRWLTITWSLCIEEHFYLLWPLVVARTPPRRLLHVCIGVFVGSYVLRGVMLAAPVSPRNIYSFTMARLDGLALGSALAVVFADERLRPRVVQLASRALVPLSAAVIGLAVLGALLQPRVTDYNRYLTQSVGFAVIALFYVSLLACTAAGSFSGSLARLFDRRLLRLLGTHSYAMYLIHWPLVVLTKRAFRDSAWVTTFSVAGSRIPAQALYTTTLIVTTLLLSLVVWHLYEKHFLSLKRHVPYAAARPSTQASARAAPALTSERP